MALVRPIWSPWMWETWSRDGGATWSPCVRGPFPGYATPSAMRTRSGAILVAPRLPCLTMQVSRDDARRREAGTITDGGLWAMGCMREVSPGVVLYVYWDNLGSLMR